MFDFLSDAGAWLITPENIIVVMICFVVVLTIGLLLNAYFMYRTEQWMSRRVRELFHIGGTVTLARDVLLADSTVKKGQSGMIHDVFDMPRLKVERGGFHKVAIVKFDGAIVPITSGAARIYLELREHA